MRNRSLFYKVQIFILILLSGIVLSFLPNITANASNYHSWMREGEELYGGDVGTPSDTSNILSYEPKDDSVLKHLVNLINSFAASINEHLFKVDAADYSVSLSGIVMGRLADYRVSILKFELFEDNPWGLVGSVVYVAFRNIIYGLMLLYCGMLLVKQLFNNGAKGRAELKAISSTVLFLFSLLYIMPWFANMFIIGRDSIILNLGERMLGVRGLDIHDSVLEVMSISDEIDIFLSLIYFALMFAPLFYVVGYASIAMQETALFGLFPVVTLLSIRDKKLLNSWCGMFFSNLAVPLLDYIFLMLPLIMKLLVNPGGGENFAYVVVTLCCIWSAQPARNAILRLFGNMGGAQANIGGMAALGMAAMRMMGGGFRGASGSGGVTSSVTDDLTNAQRFENLAGGFNEALADTQREVDKIASVDDINRELSAIGGAEDNGVIMNSLGDGPAEGGSSGIDTSEIELGTGGNAEAIMGDEAEPVLEPAQADAGEAPVIEEAALDEAGNSEMSNGISAERGAEMEAQEDNGTFYKHGEIPAEELSQRQVFQNARLDNLEKLDAAKDALNDQQQAVDLAEQRFASVGGDVPVKEAKLADNEARLKDISDELKASESYMKNYDRESKAYPSMSADEKQIFDSKYADVETHRTNISNLTNEQAALTAQNATLTKEINAVKANPEYANAAQAVTNAKIKRDKLSEVIQKRTDAEKAYATMMEGQGGSGKTYENALSYKHAINTAEMKNRQTSWRNFDAHADTSDISPDEKAAYYRQRAEHKQNQKEVSNVAKVAGTLAGGIAGMYGGVGAMATGAMLGYGISETTANKGMEFYNDRKDYKQAQNAGQTESPTPALQNSSGRKFNYSKFVETKKQEARAKNAQKQAEQNSTPIDGLTDLIRPTVQSNASKAGFTVKNNDSDK